MLVVFKYKGLKQRHKVVKTNSCPAAERGATSEAHVYFNSCKNPMRPSMLMVRLKF